MKGMWEKMHNKLFLSETKLKRG